MGMVIPICHHSCGKCGAEMNPVRTVRPYYLCANRECVDDVAQLPNGKTVFVKPAKRTTAVPLLPNFAVDGNDVWFEL